MKIMVSNDSRIEEAFREAAEKENLCQLRLLQEEDGRWHIDLVSVGTQRHLRGLASRVKLKSGEKLELRHVVDDRLPIITERVGPGTGIFPQ